MSTKLYVNYFGTFRILNEQRQVILRQTRNNKCYSLVQYLIFRGEQGASRSDLLAYLTGDSPVNDSANTMKIIIHRARRLLEEANIQDAILYRHGRYFWNTAYLCETDVQQFAALAAKALSCKEMSTCAELGLQAIAIHREGFLARVQPTLWQQEISSRLRQDYSRLMMRICAALAQEGRYVQLMQLVDDGLRIYPMEEDLHYMRIALLNDLGRTREIALQYERAREEVDSDCFRVWSLTKRLGSEQLDAAPSLSELMPLLDNPSDSSTMFCLLDVFAENYRYIRRLARLQERPLTLLMVIVQPEEGRHYFQGESAALCASRYLYHIIRNSLKSSDLFARSGVDSYVILSVCAGEEELTELYEKIKQRFHELYPDSRGTVSCQMLTDVL